MYYARDYFRTISLFVKTQRQKLSCENVLHKLTVYTGICVSTMAFSDFNKQKTDRLKGF